MNITDFGKALDKLKPKCSWCETDLTGKPIHSYDHDGGWKVEGFTLKQWLYVSCPKCNYDWAIWKFGISRSMGDNPTEKEDTNKIKTENTIIKKGNPFDYTDCPNCKIPLTTPENPIEVYPTDDMLSLLLEKTQEEQEKILDETHIHKLCLKCGFTLTTETNEYRKPKCKEDEEKEIPVCVACTVDKSYCEKCREPSKVKK